MKTVEEYRQYAEECRKLAAKTSNPKDKRVIETMADAWDKVANERETAARKQRS
jgi:hypothetical protein